MHIYNKGYKSIIITLKDGNVITFNRDHYISLEIDKYRDQVTVVATTGERIIINVAQIEY